MASAGALEFDKIGACLQTNSKCGVAGVYRKHSMQSLKFVRDRHFVVEYIP